MIDVIEHYDKLIEENNDPFYDPKPLRDYMDKWDGQAFIDAMKLDKSKIVLEIGCGTGRIAAKTAPLCDRLVGIDISPKTVERAVKNLASHQNVKLICGDFTSCDFEERFDVIYSSLTFMHIENKLAAIKKVASLLLDDGILVLSIDKNQAEYIDMGTRRIKIYPDTKADMQNFILQADLKLTACFETDMAYVLVAKSRMR